MFNKVVLVGNLTRDIELRYTTAGAAIGNSSIAVTRKFTANGEKREETCFIDITFFGKQAEIANQYLSKGSKLLVEGRLKFDQWTDNNGQNRSKHSVSVENMEMLGGSGQQQGGFNQNSNQQGGYSQSGGYGNQNYSNQSYGQNTNSYANNGAKTPSQQNYNRQPRQDDYNDRIQDIDVDADKYDSDETIPF
ncbi:single-stranded DNA-binding protein [Campylobacter sp. RM16192]|uniref:single-stranded DNA-binding protein n=1 Tax=Campylobacter sp. RM16192 TaxID=1660080 RepID=UPI00145238B7|nr:single-stranded DNA-binding protein [Campylobacter sp. RM16192]QCD52905.1 single-stranded DNA binding protein [Campylobacter sp. RM16192]